MKILITGAAGFIGFHLVQRLAAGQGFEIIGIDNLNTYYDPNLKFARLKALGIDPDAVEAGKMLQSQTMPNVRFLKMNLEDTAAIDKLFDTEQFNIACNLAAQAGVRYSLKNPYPYVHTNVLGFLNILEASKRNNLEHLIYASSSSVYGLNNEMPFSPKDAVDHPVSLYAATKRSNELMAHTYSHLYGLPTTGLRFFTVYGPYGRPDMAYFSFTRMILARQTIKVFNHGNMRRDFTYIDDITEGIFRLLGHPPKGGTEDRNQWGPNLSKAPYSIYNIGNHQPVRLMDFIGVIEKTLGIEADKEMLPMQPGDVEETYADIDDLQKLCGFNPSTPLEVGLPKFIEWYLDFYKPEGAPKAIQQNL